MEYSTHMGKLIMPEYGRNVQRMIEHACTLQDKEERTRCVQAIIQTMQNLFPYLRNEESRHKVYDHLAIMSDFKLDIDSPFEQPTLEELKYKPERLPYQQAKNVRFKHYGRLIQTMVQQAIQEEDVEKRKVLVRMIAVRMRQNYNQWNKEDIDNDKIREDLDVLSKGLLTPLFEGLPRKSETNERYERNNRNNRTRKWKR